MKLTMKNSPYMVEPSNKPQEAIELMLERGLLKKHKIDNDILQGYLKSENNIPFWIIEAACKLNQKSIDIPIQYQNVWFCLNQSRFIRELPSKTIKPKLNFYSVYIEPTEKVTSLINKAVEKVGSKTRLAKLCGVKHRQLIQQWATKKIKPQLMGFMKICDILEEDIWKILNGHKLYGRCCPEDESFTFYNFPRNKILDILIWIKLEGHLPLAQGAVETNQKKEDKEILERFARRIMSLYNMNPKSFLIYDNSTNKGTNKDWKGFKLHISSSPFRQILCLRYGISLGYKCSFIDISDELKSCENKEDFNKLLSTVIESEGSFTFRRENEYNRPITSVTSLSYKLIKEITNSLRKKRYNVYYVDNYSTKSSYDVRIQGLDSFVRCCFNILPYFSHHSKLKMANSYLSDEKILLKIWIKPSFKIKELIRTARNRHPNSHKNKSLAEELMKTKPEKLYSDFRINRHIVNGWLSLNKSLSLLAVILLCRTLNKDYFRYMPKHLGLVLWVHGFITRKELEILRGINESFKHMEAFNNGL